MVQRVSKSHRIKLQNVAEREIQRYADDHGMWHKHVTNIELDPVQILKCWRMDQYPNTLDYSCRRIGKTFGKAMYQLKFNAVNSDQELGIVAPRQAQAQNNLRYHTDRIRESQILSAYLDWKSGREQMADSYYQFCNRSKAQAYGIMSQIDGGDMTHSDLEEVDDMPHDRLNSRFLLMMGSKRRAGAAVDAVNKPQIRVSGVFKGADTLSNMVATGQFHVLPVLNVHMGIEMGLLDQGHMALMAEELTADEYMRQLICENVSARNFIWESKVRRAMTMGLKAGFDLVEPLPGSQYQKRGLVSFGYDAGGHGENPSSSRHSLVVAEDIQGYTFFPFVYSWPAAHPEPEVMADIVSFWRYFRPDYAIGDAFGIGMMTVCNDVLFGEGLVDVDRRAVGDGQSAPSTWVKWPFSPLRFEGMVKHSMATSLRSKFANDRAIIPFVDPDDPEAANIVEFCRQLPNVRAVPNKSRSSYPSYVRADVKMGDDHFDAAMAAVWALVTRGLAQRQALVLPGAPQSRGALLEGLSVPRLSTDRDEDHNAISYTS